MPGPGQLRKARGLYHQSSVASPHPTALAGIICGPVRHPWAVTPLEAETCVTLRCPQGRSIGRLSAQCPSLTRPPCPGALRGDLSAECKVDRPCHTASLQLPAHPAPKPEPEPEHSSRSGDPCWPVPLLREAESSSGPECPPDPGLCYPLLTGTDQNLSAARSLSWEVAGSGFGTKSVSLASVLPTQSSPIFANLGGSVAFCPPSCQTLPCPRLHPPLENALKSQTSLGIKSS